MKFKITDSNVGIFNSHESLAAKGMKLAYSATAHDYQGSSVDRVLLVIESSGLLANQQAFYVGLSRMRDEPRNTEG